MKRAILLISLSCLLLMTACQSAESKELMDYHNGFVDEVVRRVEMINVGYDEMDTAATDEEAIDIAHTKILATIGDIKKYMNEQNPKEEDAKAYHKIRSEWFGLYEDIVSAEIQALDDYVNGRITDKELDEIYEGIIEKSVRAEELAVEAEKRFAELVEKHELGVSDE